MLQASLLWQCNDLIEILQKKIIAKENQKEILRAIVFDLTNGYTLTTIEQYVINNFFDFTTQPSFLTLNVDIIKRVSPWPFDSTIDSQQLFNFYTDVFNKQGKVASSLFQYVNLEQVNLSDIIKLISDIHFDRSVLIGQLVSLVSKYENELINSENELQKQTQIASNLEKEAIACGQICEEKENELLECEHNILIVQSAIESSLHISTYQMNDGINEIYEMQCKKNELLKEGAKVSDELKAAEEQYNEAMAKLKQKRKKSENKK
ncbi:hypothetical protein GPJ56_008784 [Histomonas meleagridis]|uniref:uncharacterized protein n=1 Tax=Histomonas meleagridis TaxID=135588 RepID=UPI0035594963|nr:hypothetical protein GPJ56_008784 [Histomonas meleagridis]KAH0805424.1 hypothetical protein GO595_001806 [Histomonas meleagridis]